MQGGRQGVDAKTPVAGTRSIVSRRNGDHTKCLRRAATDSRVDGMLHSTKTRLGGRRYVVSRLDGGWGLVLVRAYLFKFRIFGTNLRDPRTRPWDPLWPHSPDARGSNRCGKGCRSIQQRTWPDGDAEAWPTSTRTSVAGRRNPRSKSRELMRGMGWQTEHGTWSGEQPGAVRGTSISSSSSA